MNFVSDIVLNFSDISSFKEFYEWDLGDSILTAQKIPIFHLLESDMKNVFYTSFQVDSSFLEEIEDKTITDMGVIRYCCLFTDFSRVIACRFSSDGCVIKKSSLLLDEEDVVMEENCDIVKKKLSYTVLKNYSMFSMLTKKEEMMQKYLLSELRRINEKNNMDEIRYLYYETFSRKNHHSKMYEELIDEVKNHFSENCVHLYEIMKMIPSGT